mgnify:FL=1
MFKFPEGTGAIAQNVRDAKARLIRHGPGKPLKIIGMGSLSRPSLTSEKLNRGTRTDFKDKEEGHMYQDGSIRLNISIGGKLKSESEVVSVMRESRIIMGALDSMPPKANLYAEHIQTGDMDTIKLYIGRVESGEDFAYIELKDGEVVHRHIDMDIVKYYSMRTSVPFDFLTPDKYAEGETSYTESTKNSIDQAFTRAIGIVLHNRSTMSGLNQIAKDRDALSKSVGKEGKAEIEKWENKTIKRIGGTNVYVKQPITTKEEDQFWEDGQSNSLRDVMNDENNFGLFTNEDLGCK